eukprot:473858_1
MSIISLLFILTALPQTTIYAQLLIDASQITDIIYTGLAHAERDRADKFTTTNARFDTVDTSISSLKTYLKTEIDAQSGLITTGFTDSTTNINDQFTTSTDNINNQFSISTNNINTQFTSSTNNINYQFGV